MRVKLRHRRLARELASRPMSLNRWALKLGLSRGHLSELVNGKKPYPAAKTREKLLRGLSLAFEDLFELEYPHSSEEGRPRKPIAHRARRSLPTEHVMTDLHVACRSLAKRPLFTLAAVLTLAIGIGSNTTLFTLVHSLLWKPFPYGEPEALVRVYGTIPSRGFLRNNLSYRDFLAYRERAPRDVLEDVAVSDWEPFNLATGDEAIRVGGGVISSNLFDVLDVSPILGRSFRPEDDDVLLLSDALFRSQFGGDPDTLGRVVLVNGRPRTIIGVMPTECAYPERSRLWVPLPPDVPRDAHFLQATARLAPGATAEQLQLALASIAESIAADAGETQDETGVRVVELREAIVGDMRPLSFAALGAVAFVLLIVCANVANLLLARGVGREREMALRKALGATQMRLARQLLTEGLLLGALGCGLGIAFGWLGIRLQTLLVEIQIPEWVRMELDPSVLGYTVLVSLVAVALFGVAPALQASRAEVRANRPQGSPGLRGALVVSEVALSLVLLTGAGLMLTSLMRLASVDPGFETRGRLTVGLDLLAHARETPGERLGVFDRFLERLRSLPGVDAVGVVDRLPLKGSSNSVGYRLEGQSEADAAENPFASTALVSADYFRAMGIPVLHGTPFPENRDDERDVIVSESFARHHWPSGTSNAIGRRLRLPWEPDRWLTIRAVVGDVRHYGLDQEVRPHLYMPYHTNPRTRMTWVLATPGDPNALVGAVRDAVREVDPAQPLYEVMPLEEVVHHSAWMWRFFARLFWGFAAMALLLAAVGIYGVVAYAASQRTQELGIRMALGAGRGRLMRLVLGQGARLVAVGIAVGLPLSLLLGRAIASHLYGVAWFEASATLSVLVLLFTVAMLAVAIPARRASKVDPLTALRYE